MLRKSSRSKAHQLEQERLIREKAKLREVPRLPAPDLSTFGSDNEGRATSNPLLSDPSFAPNGITTSHSAANFSRPNPIGGAMPDTGDASSSPAYNWRTSSLNSSSPLAGANGAPADSHARTESMTHRGRYSYASSAGGLHVNSPRRVRRRKDPTPFNVLVIGAKNSGKTSFITFLRHSLALPADKQSAPLVDSPPQQQSTGTFESHYLETEIEGERIGVTLWDSAGLEKSVVDLQLREMTAFVESKFEDTFLEEQKVMRSPGVQDTHIHCVFLILDPVRLDTSIAESVRKDQVARLDDDLDLQIIRALWGKTTVIPVISKADTLTTKHMAFLKRTVSESLKRSKLDPLEALEFEDDEDDDGTIDEEDEAESASDEGLSNGSLSEPKRPNHKRHSSISATIATNVVSGDDTPYLPMSILSPDFYELPPYATAPPDGKIGRHFAWGFADPYDSKHCDFIRLRDSIFTEWRGDLRDLARIKWYENWRTSRLRTRPARKQSRGEGGRSLSNAEPNKNISNGASVPRSVSAYVPGPSGPLATHPVPPHILKATAT